MLPVGRSELMFASGSFLSPSLIRILQHIFFSHVLEKLLIIKPSGERLVFVNLDTTGFGLRPSPAAIGILIPTGSWDYGFILSAFVTASHYCYDPWGIGISC